jgi:hypothetical protein
MRASSYSICYTAAVNWIFTLFMLSCPCLSLFGVTGHGSDHVQVVGFRRVVGGQAVGIARRRDCCSCNFQTGWQLFTAISTGTITTGGAAIRNTSRAFTGGVNRRRACIQTPYRIFTAHARNGTRVRDAHSKNPPEHWDPRHAASGPQATVTDLAVWCWCCITQASGHDDGSRHQALSSDNLPQGEVVYGVRERSSQYNSRLFCFGLAGALEGPRMAVSDGLVCSNNSGVSTHLRSRYSLRSSRSLLTTDW